MRLGRLKTVLGVEIPAEQVEIILQHLGLQPEKTAEGFRVISPSFRFDIEIEADLIEEIGRVYGYENIPDDYTSGRLKMLALPETKRPRFAVYNEMAARGYREVVSYAFVDEQWEQDFAANTRPIRLQNPLAAQYAVMRSTLIGGLVEVLQNNLNRKQNRVRVFEIARVFRKDSADQFVQNERIGGLWYGSVLPEQWGEKTRNVDFYDMKADVESLLKNKEVSFVKTEHPALHPGRAANIVSDGRVIGFVGELHPKWLQKYDLPQAPLVFEIEMDEVLGREKTRYQSVSKFQPARRDLAFVMPEAVTHDDLLNALKAAANKLVQEISVFDVYRGTGVPEGMKSVAVKIILQDMENTLTDEVIEPVIGKLIDTATAAGAQLRG